MRVGFDNKTIDQFNEELNFLSRELLSFENENDNINYNERYFLIQLNELEKNILTLFYNKSINSQHNQEIRFINFYVHIIYLNILI